MNIIENELDIQKMYKYQLENLKSDEYKNYLKYLDFYYSKEHKKDKYSRTYENGKYILTDRSKTTKKITITPSNFINIHILYIELKKYSEIILNKISNLIESKQNITDENRKEFEELKKKYLSFRNHINDINIINKEFYKEIDELFSQKIEKSNNLAKYSYKRVTEFELIETMIKESLKNKLIKIYKDNNKKIPSTSEINKIAKENNIPSKDIENWFNWIESIYLYMVAKNDLVKLDKLIEEKEEKFYIDTKYMIIRKPIVEE